MSPKLYDLIIDEIQSDGFDAETPINEIEGWDSLAHVRIIDRIEKEYGVSFTTEQIISIKKVGDIQKCLQS